MSQAEAGIDLRKYGYSSEFIQILTGTVDPLSPERVFLENLTKDPKHLLAEVTVVLEKVLVGHALGFQQISDLDRIVAGIDQPDEDTIIRTAICADFIYRMRENYPPDGNPSLTNALFVGMKDIFGGRSMFSAMRHIPSGDLAAIHQGFIECQVHELTDAFSAGMPDYLWRYFGKPEVLPTV